MPHMSAADRRADLVAAAVVVIAAHGVDGATTRRISEQANAPLASLHYVFHTKEELFGAVCRELSRVLCEEVIASDVDTAGLGDAASAILRRIMNWYLEESEFSVAAVELILWARRQHGDLAVKIYDDAFEACRGVLDRFSDGTPASAALIDRIPTMIASIADGHVLNWLTYGDDRAGALEDIEAAVEVVETWIAHRLTVAGTGGRAKKGSRSRAS